MNCVIIDTGCANLSSVAFALERLGVEPAISAEAEIIKSASHVVLPGVGSAPFAMKQINARNLVPIVRDLTQPVLGICLGMQLLFETLEEGQEIVEGFGVIKGHVGALDTKDLPSPHMGWNTLTKVSSDPILTNINNNDYAYFVHSFAAPIGDYDQRTDYDASPIDVAKSFAEQGATRMHVVDLDGAKRGKTEQTDLIIELAKESGLKVQTGGGIRELSQVQRLLKGGIERVVVGSLSITNPQMVKFWINDVGADKLVMALDVNLNEDGVPYPATHGWTEAGERDLWDVIDGYSGSGLRTVLITDIGRDGVLKGSNVQLYKDVQKRYPELDIITSGGVGKLTDVKRLKKLNPHGIIIGKALYENRFTVAEAVAC